MFCHKKCKIGILCPKAFVLITVSVDSHNAVCIFIDHDSVRVHTEGSYVIFKFLRAVNDLALIEFIG